jgi:hypothetical protein
VVAADHNDVQRALGYYAIGCSGQASQRMAPGRYHQPVVILTRLGVDLSCRGADLGRALVVDA